MKILTVLGTRPEIIRLSLIIKKLDELAEKHILVHTGQNFTENLSEVFFKEMKIRKPDYILINQQYSLGQQLSIIYRDLEKILLNEKPDKILILGDTNSGLTAILAERMGIPVIHMEAGNRCYDLEVPEEKNRKVIDAISSLNLPYTPQSKENLLREGVSPYRVIVTGNPIYEVLQYYGKDIENSKIIDHLNLKNNDYFLVTVHRAENVDNEAKLLEIMNGLNCVAETYGKRIICSIHPRTKSKLEKTSFISLHSKIEFHEPFGFFDFVSLEKNAFCVLTDSGTVQEECCIFQVPAVTVRKTTERPETVECGSNMVSGIDAKRIAECVKVMINMPRKWALPEGYQYLNVSDRVTKIVLGGKTHV
ncbi:UDP-N-acetylglucosamine 2-epimerase (non-hydrolyzing) [Cytobacillus firmus]|uniref:non-hydrolyzing UDP-N-acetylglucosamine 2-epimerase n=1 Tax=Cytobacillus firmus TaxID=1399 RepID=UPI001C93DB11|nr:UDP-N-acetylglucosamine 2-epimerase (non-hydrolyzing) [Cytobacillus firmus]MBY6053353.1 UDP-N-acetylglucosamine 2-epimerase (non-hydrolyzing) [Cytobacillus firmus]USK41234.1 UDP-N-acetylglucosamine 2-epimerase (non-hydrolyzing) [Cytobacillus firmus]